MFNTKEQEIIKWGVANGKSKDEITKAINTFRIGMPSEGISQIEEEPSYFQRVGQQYTDIGKEIQTSITQALTPPKPGEGILKKALQIPRAALRTVGGIAKAAFAPIVEAPVIKPALEKVGQVVAKIPGVQQLFELSEKYPEASKDIENIVNILAVKQIGATKLGQKPVKEIAVQAGKVVGKVAVKAKDIVIGTKTYAVSRIPKLLGIFSGEKDDVINYAIRNPEVARQALKAGDVALREVVEEGATKSIQIKNAFIKAYTTAKDKVLGKYTKTLVPKNEVSGLFDDLLKQNNVRIGKDGILDFTKSKIIANPGEITKINAAYNALRQWDKFTISSLDEYKQLVGRLTKFATEAGVPSKSPILGRFYNELNNIAKTKLPEDIAKSYISLNNKFSSNISLYDDLVDAFNSGDPFVRLANAFGKNKDTLRQILDFYEKQSGKPVLSTVAGRELGMAKLTSTGAFSWISPRSWIDFLISPEKQGEIILKIGEVLPK